MEQNPDVAAAVIEGTFSSGFEHYVLFGQGEGRAPSGLFDEQVYLSTNADAASAISAGDFSSGFE